MNLTCRILPHLNANGPRQMAIDEALLDSVAANPRQAVLRTYEWSEPTLSLGYFQSIARVDADGRWTGVPIVRRPTGGGAIWHDRELTYALVLPSTHPLARRDANLYHAVHGAIAGLLLARGVEAMRRGGRAAESPTDRPLLCFDDHDPEDLVVSGYKVVGSAQRRRAGAVLQHGSILLARSPRVPTLLGVSDLGDDTTTTQGWAEFLPRVLAAKIGLVEQPNELTAQEHTRAAELVGEVYRSPSWNHKR